MVRDKNTIFAESNDPDTVLDYYDMDFPVDALILGYDGTKNVVYLRGNGTAIVRANTNRAIKLFTTQPNKMLGTDANGNLAWL